MTTIALNAILVAALVFVVAAVVLIVGLVVADVIRDGRRERRMRKLPRYYKPTEVGGWREIDRDSEEWPPWLN